MWQRAITCLLTLLLVSGCNSDTPNIAEHHDDQIESSWMQDRDMVDAVQFLEDGGVYENTLPDHDIDAKIVLPLVRQLRDEFALDVYVLLTDSAHAHSVIVDISELPRNDDRRPLIVDAIQKADDEFPGLLADKWGEEWLSFDLLDEFETKVFTKADLEALRKNIRDERDANRG